MALRIGSKSSASYRKQDPVRKMLLLSHVGKISMLRVLSTAANADIAADAWQTQIGAWCMKCRLYRPSDKFCWVIACMFQVYTAGVKCSPVSGQRLAGECLQDLVAVFGLPNAQHVHCGVVAKAFCHPESLMQAAPLQGVLQTVTSLHSSCSITSTLESSEVTVHRTVNVNRVLWADVSDNLMFLSSKFTWLHIIHSTACDVCLSQCAPNHCQENNSGTHVIHTP